MPHAAWIATLPLPGDWGHATLVKWGVLANNLLAVARAHRRRGEVPARRGKDEGKQRKDKVDEERPERGQKETVSSLPLALTLDPALLRKMLFAQEGS